MTYDIDSLNEEQKKALYVTDGAILVTAGAGSGKTRLLTHRIAYLIKEKGVSPFNILAITFTNKAANEMRERVAGMVQGAENVWISTFHSMCAKILRLNIHNLDSSYDNNFTIYSDSDTDKVIKQIQVEMDRTDDDKFKKNLAFHISNYKNNFNDLNVYKKENEFDRNIDEIIPAIIRYEEILRENNAVDFDDLLILTDRLFERCPEVLQHYADRFHYILVDEFQDTNKIQFDLVKKLASVHKNLFVVGDEDQCIYSWRGANFENIYHFKDNFENVQVFKLERNYRSTKNILNTANLLIKNNKSRYFKNLWTEKDDGNEVVRRELNDEQEEADYVSRTIYSLANNNGYSYKDFAILLRLNALTLPFEERLLAYNIPHKIFGGFKFYERAEIKNVLSYLRLFVNPKDEQAFLRVINFPKRGIGDSAIASLRKVAINNKKSLLETCLNIENLTAERSLINKFSGFARIYKDLLSSYELEPLDEFTNEVIEKFGIKLAYQGKNEEDIDKLMNIDSLLASIQSFVQKNPSSGLSEYLESVSLVSDIDSFDESNNVTVATVHAVKGLEFKVVFVVGLEEKIFPISRAIGSDADMEEERRLMYVAITRAEENLFLTNCRTRFIYGKRDYMIPSRFLGELGYTNVKAKTSYFTERHETPSYSHDINAFKTTASQSTTFTKAKVDTSIYKVGQMVLHTKFGIGTIQSITADGKCADIAFNGIGTKTLLPEIAPLKIIK